MKSGVDTGAIMKIRSSHRSRSACAASDEYEDVLRMFDEIRRGAEHADLSGLHRHAGRSAGAEQEGGRICDQDRSCDELHDQPPTAGSRGRTISTPTFRRAIR